MEYSELEDFFGGKPLLVAWLVGLVVALFGNETLCSA
jgi:hypothetical protein